MTLNKVTALLPTVATGGGPAAVDAGCTTGGGPNPFRMPPLGAGAIAGGMPIACVCAIAAASQGPSIGLLFSSTSAGHGTESHIMREEQM